MQWPDAKSDSTSSVLAWREASTREMLCCCKGCICITKNKKKSKIHLLKMQLNVGKVKRFSSQMSQQPEESIDIVNVFFGAIVAGDVQRVVSMLESKQVSSDVSFLRGQQARFSALGFAAYRGQVAIVDCLLEHGASIDGVSPMA
jgi:riboflavin synthase alpha subunit